MEEVLARWFPELPLDYMAKRLRHNEMNMDHTVKELIEYVKIQQVEANEAAQCDNRPTTTTAELRTINDSMTHV